MKTSTLSNPVFQLTQGHIPLLISMPHLGTHLPEELATHMTPEARRLTDTDWHMDRLYGFATDLGASVLRAQVSRYVIDLNRPPTGESLYPGQTTTGLCPTETFRGDALYQPGQQPDTEEIDHRREVYWQPYHAALGAELARLRQLHGQVLLWDAHSIASVLPRLFEGRLPDLNFGSASGASCAPAVMDAALAQVNKMGSPWSQVLNGRFKGGYITRHYGQPTQGVHAIQLELCQCLYMDESLPFDYLPERAQQLQPDLVNMLRAATQAVRQLNGGL